MRNGRPHDTRKIGTVSRTRFSFGFFWTPRETPKHSKNTRDHLRFLTNFGPPRESQKTQKKAKNSGAVSRIPKTGVFRSTKGAPTNLALPSRIHKKHAKWKATCGTQNWHCLRGLGSVSVFFGHPERPKNTQKTLGILYCF